MHREQVETPSVRDIQMARLPRAMHTYPPPPHIPSTPNPEQSSGAVRMRVKRGVLWWITQP